MKKITVIILIILCCAGITALFLTKEKNDVINGQQENAVLYKADGNFSLAVESGKFYNSSVIGLAKGSYILEINGLNSEDSEYYLSYNSGKNEVPSFFYYNKETKNISCFFRLNRNIKDFEVSIVNNGKENTAIKEIKICPSNSQNNTSVSSDFKISRIFVRNRIKITDENLFNFLCRQDNISFFHITLMQWFRVKYSANTVFIIDKYLADYFKTENLHFYQAEDVIILSKVKLSGLKEYHF